MALTGFTRSGKCGDHNDDAGSHHVCIDLSSKSITTGNFCSVTNQPNWCDSRMQCDGKRGQCPVEHWCVCEWAFASYIQKAGGCDKIQSIICEATNLMALKHYKEQAESSPHIKEALQCLVQRCGGDLGA